MKTKFLMSTVLAGLTALSVPAFAGGEPAGSGMGASKGSSPQVVNSLADAFKNGKAYIDARYRYETVDDSTTGITQDGEASTLRTRVGFTTAKFYNLQGSLEMENVSQLGDEDYDDGSNSKTTYGKVADPEGSELNQAWLSFDGVPATTIKYGRQVLNLGNQRFIGSVGWRQNDQTFDAVTLTNNSVKDTELFYGYSYNVNRISGSNASGATAAFNGDIHMLNANYSGLGFGKVGLYGYWLDLENSAANSSQTIGANFVGSYDIGSGAKALYDLEFAQQSDYGDNTNSYDANYWKVEPGISWNGLTAKAGMEVLGADVAGDAGRVFSTPLATLHKWNGWADRFLATPAGGLEDKYGSIGYKLSGVHEYLDGTKFTVVYHDYSVSEGSGDIGNEWDYDVTQTVFGNYTVGVKYANYTGETTVPTTALSSDVDKLIFTFGVKFSQ